MLDLRMETFLNLCETKSYTKTAEILNITQPTVTQHIQYLEKRYQAELVRYSGRNLSITDKGEELKKYGIALKVNNQKMEQAMLTQKEEKWKINFGATRTIGEYIMPQFLVQYAMENPKANITMQVDNTATLLKRLEDGAIDFAIIEGYFDKGKYSHQVFQKADFIGVCGKTHPGAKGKVKMDDLLDFRLIIRENGSGTRDIFESLLHEHNLNLKQFSNTMEIGNFNAIKDLVCNDIGVTFLYEAVVKKELEEGRIVKMDLEHVQVIREYNLVYLKDDLFVERYQDFWKFIAHNDKT